MKSLLVDGAIGGIGSVLRAKLIRATVLRGEATPCVATVAATRREEESSKWALLQFGGLTVVTYLLTLVVHQTGLLLS